MQLSYDNFGPCLWIFNTLQQRLCVWMQQMWEYTCML
jgi:hypothetical protein